MARDWRNVDPEEVHQYYVQYKEYLEQLIEEAYLNTSGKPAEPKEQEIPEKLIRKQKLRADREERKQLNATRDYWKYVRMFNKTGKVKYAAKAVRLEKKSTLTLRDAEDQFFGE
jgi:hypothetical protein